VTQKVTWRGLLPLAGAVLLFSSAWPVTKEAIGHGAGAVWFALGRTSLSALVTLALLVAMRRLAVPTWRDMPFFLSVALAQLALFFVCVHLALVWVEAGRTSVITSVTLVFTVPASVLLLGEEVPRARWAGVGLGLAGIVLLIGPWSIDWTAPGVLLGHAFLLVAAAAVGVPMLVVRLYPPRLSMVQLLPWAFGLASLVLLPFAWAMEAPGHWNGGALAALLYVGLLAGPIGTWCYLLTMIHLPVVVASVGFLMTPAVGLLLATWWLGERLGMDLLLGTALILSGVGVAVVPGRKR
jgi:O-acetylserine/cysteine efflux transporter